MIHRDVKPGNILLGRGPGDDLPRHVYLSDFGLTGRAEDEDGADAGQLVGTLEYVSPEQVEGKPVSPQTDVYSFGCVLYQCLTGEVPFPRASRIELLWAHLEDDPPRPSERTPGLPQRLDAVIARALAKNPQSRYASCRELVEAARQALGLKAGAARLQAVTAARNPYKGLRPFEEADADDFFGREALIEALLERLSDPAGGRFLAIVGPSGSGKSSLLKAGLLPACAGAVAGSERWLIAELVPGPDPFEELAAALLRAAPRARITAEELREDAGALSRCVERLLADDATSCSSSSTSSRSSSRMAGEEERGRFLASLQQAVSEPRARVRLVLALRADFYDRPLRYREFGALLEAGQANVHPLSPAELEQAITRPADAVGVALEPGLVADIVADVAESPSALPLLQYALTELFERRESDTLTVEAYRRIGGVSGALARRAEELYGELDGEAREAARKLFTRLVTLGEAADDTRRRVRREEVEELEGSAPAIEEVIDAFGRRRLLSFDRDPITQSPTVEIAHEALLREWPRLRAWIDEDRDGLRLLRHLSEAAAAWRKLDRDPGELYRGARLETALAWAEAHPDDLSPLEREFLDRGRDLRGEEERAEQERAEQRIRQNRRLRIALGVVAIGLVGALAAGILALRARNDEAEARSAAETGSARRRVGQHPAEEPPARASPRRRGSPPRSLRRDPRRAPALADGEPGLPRLPRPGRQLRGGRFLVGRRAPGRREAATRSRSTTWPIPDSLSRIELPGPANATAVSAGGELAAVATGSVVRLYDLATRRERRRSEHSAPVTALTFSPHLDRLAAGTADGKVVVQNLSSGTLGQEIDAHATSIRELAFSRDGALLATAPFAAPSAPPGVVAVRVWDARTGAKIGRDLDSPRDPGEERSGASAIEFGRGATLFVGGRRAIRRWNVRTGRQLGDVRHPGLSARVDPTQESAIIDVALIARSTAALGTGAKVTLVDVETGRALGEPLDSQLNADINDHTVRNLAVSRDASMLAVAGKDGIALWSLDGRQLIARALPRGEASFAVV